jgi:hypothetical protein
VQCLAWQGADRRSTIKNYITGGEIFAERLFHWGTSILFKGYCTAPTGFHDICSTGVFLQKLHCSARVFLGKAPIRSSIPGLL